MKVAQLLATIPDALPPEYAAELMKLQSEAPPMGWAFVQAAHDARSSAPTGRRNFKSFEHQPAAAASLGQVHRARSLDGERARLQAAISRHAVGGGSRPAASSAWLLAIHRRMDPAIDTSEIAKEIGARMREELDYRREAKHVALYQRHAGRRARRSACPDVWPELRPAACSRSTGWRASGCSSTRTRRSPTATGSRSAMFTAWWMPFSRFGVIHGDPHLGNYTVFEESGQSRAGDQPARLWLHPHLSRRASSAAWSISIAACSDGDDARVVHAYETWGFKKLVTRTDRHAQHLGAVHLRPAAGRPRAHHRRRREARRIWPPRGLPGAPGAARAGAR